ncbi:hypothetical protein PP175_08250 [Aneurinibacillus sp. Ricciae_BoGa-3]|uniref:hypothetical protein n=1 Tax=Aneurinibacillus sp. Ricciae_BoGa-3 TaxID=3022697 RepID=UPI002340C6AA|nr:hypothetical protein [Aneurinibacillus sp. Ricciae_BoGa-3]WCK55895.1 hypothetical protein PP175_08250 [Aneurinibacillus sp. Ricciae_BoGa-3]
MWLRNIIWFILLLGIIILSIFLFVLVMNPVTDTSSDTGQAQPTQQSTPSPNTKITVIQPPKASVGPTVSTPPQPDSGTNLPKKPGDANPQQNPSGQIDNTRVPQASPANPANPDQKKANETPISNGYTGRITGFITLVAAIFPFLFLLAEGLPRLPSMRRFYQAFLPVFPFFGFVFLAVAAVHGGVMLYMQTKWTTAGGTGLLLYAIFLFMLLRASLAFVRRRAPIQMRRGIAPIISLILFILFHIISGNGP